MDRLPPLRLLATFEAVSRHGSMRDAAARLNVTQPAVSQALRALEDHVGTALFDRRAGASAEAVRRQQAGAATPAGRRRGNKRPKQAGKVMRKPSAPPRPLEPRG
ncbi:helix-turn-helix domain-containing protein [Mangrovicoccus ximenensis]|uniref:helix-turn-helix domain-containing protein n=1 Tax=Mangrovicoccus ximenensis TaxID=1911570 RepID=UPI001F267003|nr:LysR family transcriptional regulator [Mangrovicoccus ximenensis]